MLRLCSERQRFKKNLMLDDPGKHLKPLKTILKVLKPRQYQERCLPTWLASRCNVLYVPSAEPPTCQRPLPISSWFKGCLSLSSACKDLYSALAKSNPWNVWSSPVKDVPTSLDKSKLLREGSSSAYFLLSTHFQGWFNSPSWFCVGQMSVVISR